MELDIKFLLKLAYDTGAVRVWNGSASESKLYLGETYEPCGSLLSIYNIEDSSPPFPMKVITIQLQSVQKNILEIIANAEFIPEYVELIVLCKNISPLTPEENWQALQSYVGSWQLLPFDHGDKILINTYFDC